MVLTSCIVPFMIYRYCWVEQEGCIQTLLLHIELFMQTQYYSPDVADNNSIWMYCWLMNRSRLNQWTFLVRLRSKIHLNMVKCVERGWMCNTHWWKHHQINQNIACATIKRSDECLHRLKVQKITAIKQICMQT